MSSSTSKLWELLKNLDPSAQFYTSGKAPTVLPGLTVKGVGPIALPVSPSNAESLISRASQAPYGEGEQTIVDPSVRRVWQLEPGDFTLDNPAWGDLLADIVDRVKKEFALTVSVKASLYKLLIYEKGSFFTSHRDSEKEAGMFGTLVICLPSRHQGGSLLVHHDGRSAEVDFGGAENSFDVQYAAFYADCEHEIRPLESGYRICFVYNLCQAGKHQPAAPQVREQARKVADLLTPVFEDRDRLAVCLQHQYTRDGLARNTLKGWDRACVAVLAEAAAVAGCDWHLAKLKWEQSGQADEGRYYGRRHVDDDEVEMDEVDEETVTVSSFVVGSGAPPVVDEFHMPPDEVASQKGLDGLPVRQSVTRTGNEGITVDRWYEGAAVVLWPTARALDGVAREGHRIALPVLAAVAKDATRTDAARRLCAGIMDHWDVQHDYRSALFVPSETMLRCLQTLGDPALASRFIEDVLPRACQGTEAAEVAALGDQVGWPSLAPAITAFLAKPRGYGEDDSCRAALKLFHDLCTSLAASPGQVKACREAAPSVERLLAQWDEADAWRRGRREGVLEALFDSLAGVGRLDVLERILDRVLDAQERYDLDKVLLPCVKSLASPAPVLVPTAVRLLQHCHAQLRERTREPVCVPKDWTMEVGVSCRCRDCQELQRFLVDPQQQIWSYRANEDGRYHVARHVDGTDVKCHTEKGRSPYTLVCTKTRASFEKRQQQYDADCNSLRELAAQAAALDAELATSVGRSAKATARSAGRKS